MTTFIYDVLKSLQNRNVNFSELTFVLPSKRAGLFLKHQLAFVVNQTIFSPEIISIEEFVIELSQLQSTSNTELLFEFYATYQELTKKEDLESFDSFSKWAQILLQDFNEIDRYLIPQEQIFNYLKAIQDINHWSLEEPKTDFIKNYLSFWEKLHQYYEAFTNRLLHKKLGYQGLIYREAVENIEAYIQSNAKKNHIFLGFNALNAAEELIIQELLQNELAEIYWDVDEVFFKNPLHDAGLFTRRYHSSWNYFKSHQFNWITQNYSKVKEISVYEVPKNIGQAKQIGTILKTLIENDVDLSKTAVILGDENLLMPILNSIPKEIETVNITMGFPLNSIALASLFEALFEMHLKSKSTFYFKHVIRVLSHQSIKPLFYQNEIDGASLMIETIKANNLIYITKEQLEHFLEQHNLDVLNLLFNSWTNDALTAITNCSKLILAIKASLTEDKKSNRIALESAFRFHELFNELNALNRTYNTIRDLKTLYGVYKEILSTETLSFQGEALEGLQIMGMLESRVLDFETVIISSVNEGTLPSGKSNNSFIPFDVKIENNLPTFKEKDAVYSYHFYRLLQRASQIHVLYNTESDILTAGEKSRFITQLELEDTHDIQIHSITPEVPVIEQKLMRVSKTESVMELIEQLANKGFSPSSLTNYIRNPIDFYYQKVLKIKEQEEVEETVATNTLGTVVHNVLEELYLPLVGKELTIESIKSMKPNIKILVIQHFKKAYKDGDVSMGKNLIISEIAQRYVANFLNSEIESLANGNSIKILAIEANNHVSISIPELDFPVNLTGKVDRVDELNGVTRIIDYKTGRVDSGKVEIVNWEDMTTDYTKYSKSFQVLTYAYMMYLKQDIELPVEGGIISFKNLNAGFLKFSKKDRLGNGATKDSLISIDTLDNYVEALKKLILEICNPEIDFIENKL